MFNGIFDQTYNRFTSFVFGTLGFKDIVDATFEDDPILQKYIAANQKLGISPQSSKQAIENTFYFQYLQYFSTTRDVYDRMLSIRRHYLSTAMITTLINDALACDPNTEKIFKINVNPNYKKSKKAEAECVSFMQRMDIENSLLDTAEDAIFYGEYFFENFGSAKKKTGIQKISDSNPPGSIFAVYDNNQPKYFFRLKKSTTMMSTTQDVEKIDRSRIWHISIFPRSLKLSIGGTGSQITYSTKDFQIAESLRVGAPFLYDVYEKIVELESLEQAQLAKIFGDLRRNAIISVAAPAGLDLKGLKEMTLWYEKVLNDSGVDDISNITSLENIKYMMGTLSKARCVPVQPERGAMSQVDVKTYTDNNTADAIEDKRKVICQTKGVPYEFLFEARDPTKTSLRQYVRYSRLVKQIQRGYIRSLRDELLIHLHSLGENFADITARDISVSCYNAINVSELDKLEFADATVAMVGSFKAFIESMAESKIGKFVNLTELARYVEHIIDTIPGAEHIIDVPDNAKDIMGGEVENGKDVEYPSNLSGNDRKDDSSSASKKDNLDNDLDKSTSSKTTSSTSISKV